MSKVLPHRPRNESHFKALEAWVRSGGGDTSALALTKDGGMVATRDIEVGEVAAAVPVTQILSAVEAQRIVEASSQLGQGQGQCTRGERGVRGVL